jgi:hypothetical protein
MTINIDWWKKKSALHSDAVYNREVTTDSVIGVHGLYMDIQYDNSDGANTLFVTFRGTEKESSMDWFSNLQYNPTLTQTMYPNILI